MRSASDQEYGDQEAPEGEERVETEGRLEALDEVAVARLDQDGGSQPEADGAAGDLEHVDDRPGKASLGLLDRGYPGGRGRRVEEPDAEAHQRKAGHDRSVALLRDEGRDQSRAEGDAERAHDRQRLRPKPLIERARGKRD